MLTVETRHAIHPEHARGMDTQALRRNFLTEGMFAEGEIRLVYTHYDRFTVGAAVPAGGALTLDKVAETRTATFLERREMGIVNIGGPGRVEAGGQGWDMAYGDVLYLGMGAGPVTFSGQGRFYITSAPAHRTLPSRLITVAEAKAQLAKITATGGVLSYARSGDAPQFTVDEIKAVAAQDTKGGVRELFRIARPALVAAIGIMLFQQLVGINSVIYFLPQVFIKGFGFPEGDAIWVSVGIGVVNFVSTIVATLIMDRFPRKGMLIFGSIVMTVSLAVLAVMNFVGDVAVLAVPTMILIAFYILGFAVSWGPIAWVLIGEIFPLSVRGIGSSFGSAANWLGNFIVSQFFLVLLDAFGNNVGGPFAIFGVFSALSIPFVMRLVPETNGKSLEEIEEEMTKR